MKILFATIALLLNQFLVICDAAGCFSEIDDTNVASIVCQGIDSNSVGQLNTALDNAVVATAGNPMNVELRESDITNLPASTLSGYPLRALIFYNNQLTTIPTQLLASVDPQLLILDLSFNLINDITKSDFDSLPFASNLQILLLAQNKITSLDPNVFASFTSLQKIRLQFNEINSLNDDVFSNLPELTEIQLYANQISQVTKNAFGELPKLRLLFLNGNNIENFENGTFSSEKFPSLDKIFLGNNPFHCDCSLQWFKDWLVATRLDKGSDPTCVYPSFNPFEFVDFCALNTLNSDGVLQDYKAAYIAYFNGLMMNDERERSYRISRLKDNLQLKKSAIKKP